MSDNEYVVTQKEAADFLNVSTKSISRYRKRGLPYKLMLNPVTGKQEVRFRTSDLERWDEGRQLLATYARDGEETPSFGEGKPSGTVGRQPASPQGDTYLDDLLLAYKQQIELLREQLEDMRAQLARRDRQIDDLMRLMVGLQLEYKPLPEAVPAGTAAAAAPDRETGRLAEEQITDLYETVILPPSDRETAAPAPFRPIETERPQPVAGQKVFSREQLAASIRRLRHKGKSFDEIARGLNQINVATLSGHPEWTILEVQTLLPGLVDGDHRHLNGDPSF